MSSEIVSIDEARLLANVNERAGQLFVSGYRAVRIDDHLVEVTSPQGEPYEVDTLFEICNCAFFTKGKHPCKHLLGWQKLLADQESARKRRLAEREQEREERE